MNATIHPECTPEQLRDLAERLRALAYLSGVKIDGTAITFTTKTSDVLSAVRREIALVTEAQPDANPAGE